jgi:hypothetical protein
MDNAIIIVAIISGLCTLLFMNVDARVFDSPKSKVTYAKGMLYGALLGGVIVYFMGYAAPTPAVAQAMMQNIGSSLIDGERVLTGMPNF